MSTSNSYDLTMDEVRAIRWALLYVRSKAPQSVVELSVDQLVELENKFVWREQPHG
jgi:hypothetical protein